MNKDDIAVIDWETMWLKHAGPPKPRKRKSLPDWDEYAESFERQFSRSDYRDKMIKKINVWPEATVLDVGCGPGTLALPIAPHVKSVTALDISGNMLRIGRDQAEQLGIDNINFLHRDWRETEIGKDIGTHDIVICSRAFVASDSPRLSLLKLNAAANHSVYLTLKAKGGSNFFSNLNEILGIPYKESPDYIFCYNLLYQLGIPAYVDFITYTDAFRYNNALDAFRVLNTHVQVTNEKQRNFLMGFVRKNMKKYGDFTLDVKSRWALIWWHKTENPYNDITTKEQY